MYSGSCSGATAVSSTNEIALPSAFVAVDRPSEASRKLQMRACASAPVTCRTWRGDSDATSRSRADMRARNSSTVSP